MLQLKSSSATHFYYSTNQIYILRCIRQPHHHSLLSSWNQFENGSRPFLGKIQATNTPVTKVFIIIRQKTCRRSNTLHCTNVELSVPQLAAVCRTEFTLLRTVAVSSIEVQWQE